MIRGFLLLTASIFLVAAAPADDARELMKQGKAKEAFALVEQAANAGDNDAIDYLAWFYDTGDVVPRDYPKAAKLYESAAKRGNRHAQWRLGVMLDLGLGVEADPDSAFRWFVKATEQGSPAAHASLGLMYAMGRGVAVDYKASMRHYREAARLGEPHGFYGVGILHARGEGVPADLAEAAAWMIVAGGLGDEDAKRLLEGDAFASLDPEAATRRANEILREFGLLSDPPKPETATAT